MLIELGGQDVLPMHMPGHKRDLREFPWLAAPCGAFDITEIEGFDDLNSPHGVLRDMLARISSLWGSRRSFLSVCGSTSALFAALSVAGDGGVLVARNCHRSVFNAAERLKLRLECVMPPVVGELGICGSVRPDDIAARLDETGCKAVVITSPTYEGVMSDIAGIAKAAHERGALLIVDAAHGAHLGLYGVFPDGGMKEADIVVSSLHKTLPALTQTAVLHLFSERADEESVAAAMAAFGTSSPSYPLMASVCGMLDYMEKKGEARLRSLSSELAQFGHEMRKLRHLSLPFAEEKTYDGIFAIDHSKLYIDCIKCGYGGFELKRRLRREFGIELESASAAGALAYATIGDGKESFDRLADALVRCDAAPDAAARREVSPRAVAFGERAEEGSCSRLTRERVPLAEAEGRTAAESVWVYPPGVPVLLAGERVTGECVRALSDALAAGGEVASPRGRLDGGLLVFSRG